MECLLPRTPQLLEIRGGPSHYVARVSGLKAERFLRIQRHKICFNPQAPTGKVIKDELNLNVLIPYLPNLLVMPGCCGSTTSILDNQVKIPGVTYLLSRHSFFRRGG
jgi:hypothetical protein